ncbi:MAG: hypothetical protein ACI4RA_11295 [Kiritimatiellia bacterium]
MKKTLITLGFCAGLVAAVEAAPTDAVTQADLQALKALIEQQNAKIEAQAKRIAELEGRSAAVAAAVDAPRVIKPGEGTETNDTGRIWTMADGRKFYLADATAGIFNPLTESGLQFEPYGYLVLEAVHNTDGTDYPMYTDYVRPRSNRYVKNHNGDHTSTLSVNDSILGFNLFSAETYNGWKTGGKFEFDLAGDDANHTDFHVRHLCWTVEHESGWQFLFGQYWHLWKMVTPQEIDGAWMENTGYPYRRSPQIRVTKKWEIDDYSSLEVRAGLVKNGPGMGGDRDGDGTQDNEQSGWCLLEGAVVYDRKAPWEEQDKRWMIGLAGQYGRDKSRRYDAETDSFLGRSDEYDSDMVMVAGSVPFGKFTLTGQLFAGENLGGVQAGIGQKVGFKDPTRKGREVSTIGGFVDLRYDLTDDWAFAIGYGFDDPTDSEAKYDSGRLYNDRAYVDAFYQLTANLHFGLEYAYLTTKYDESFGADADDHRFQFTVFYDF